MTERFALAAKDHKHQQAITSTQMQNTKTSFVSMGVGMAVAEDVSYLFPLTSFLFKQRHRRRTDSRIPPIPSFIFVTTKCNNMASNAGGHHAGANNYSKLEIQNLLHLMEGILPIGPDDWNEVLMRHSILFPYH